MYCLNCNAETSNPKFCCRSCAANYNNKKYPKRSVEGKCKICQSPIASQLVYCKSCYPNKGINPSTTLKDVTYTKHGSWNAFSYVRQLARKVAKKLGWTTCIYCGYNKHIEIAHKKALSEFDELTLLSVVNHPSNLLALCPNCHWEFDNLQIADKGIEPHSLTI